jgi:type III restriction enzyme
MQLDQFEIGKDRVSIVVIEPMADKADKDIALPQLSPILERKKSLADEIEALDVMSFSCPVLPRKEGDKAAQEFRYEAHDLITLQKLIERDYTIPAPQTAEEVVGYYARRIARDLKLPSQFAALVPKVREFLERKAFGGPVDITTPDMVKAISNNVVQYVTVKTFTAALRDLVVQEMEATLLDVGRSLSETPKFPWSRKTFAAKKCVFNLVPCDNELEKDFARFLEAADDVERFAKLPERFGFAIEYIDPAGNLRFYEPDFVVVTTDGASYLVETKGMEDVNVANKDRAARLWCENATKLTGKPWGYVKVRETEYKQLQPSLFGDVTFLGASPAGERGASAP